MSNTSHMLSESEKIDTMLARIDEIKKYTKIFRGYLNDYFSGFDSFGKSLSRLSKGLHSSSTAMPNDPTITRQIVLNFSAFENTLGKVYEQQFSEFNSLVSKVFDELTDRAENSRRKIAEKSAAIIKNVSNSKVNYNKMKVKYEKACKDAEAVLSEKQKGPKDAMKAYSLRNARKLDDLTKTSLNTWITSESLLKEAIEAANTKQVALDTVMQENCGMLKELSSLVIEKITLLMQKGIDALNMIAKICEEEIDLKPVTGEQELTLSNNDKEEEYIEEKNAIIDPAMPKGVYRKIVKIADENPNNLQEYHLQAFSEAAFRHIEANLLVMDERVRLLKAIKWFMGEMSGLYDQFSKLLQKTIKGGPLKSSSLSIFYEDYLRQSIEIYLRS